MGYAVFVLVFLASFLLFIWLRTKKWPKLLIIIFCIVLGLQFATTKVGSLTSLSNDQIRVRDMRLTEYPPVVIKIGSRSKWIPIAHWFEGRPEFRALSRIGQNFAQAIDPNFYFFSNHPRERVGFREFSIFPYFLLPFFIWGAFKFFEEAPKKLVALVLLAPIFLISFIGLDNPYGPFSLFPFISVVIALGILDVVKYLQNYGAKIKK